MPAYGKQSGVFETLEPNVNDSGTWKVPEGGWAKVSGAWEQFWNPMTTSFKDYLQGDVSQNDWYDFVELYRDDDPSYGEFQGFMEADANDEQADVYNLDHGTGYTTVYNTEATSQQVNRFYDSGVGLIGGALIVPWEAGDGKGGIATTWDELICGDLTQDAIFDALAPFVPNTNDESYDVCGTLEHAAKDEGTIEYIRRASSTRIYIYLYGSGTEIVDDGNTSKFQIHAYVPHL